MSGLIWLPYFTLHDNDINQENIELISAASYHYTEVKIIVSDFKIGMFNFEHITQAISSKRPFIELAIKKVLLRDCHLLQLGKVSKASNVDFLSIDCIFWLSRLALHIKADLRIQRLKSKVSDRLWYIHRAGVRHHRSWGSQFCHWTSFTSIRDSTSQVECFKAIHVDSFLDIMRLLEHSDVIDIDFYSRPEMLLIKWFLKIYWRNVNWHPSTVLTPNVLENLCWMWWARNKLIHWKRRFR